MIALGGLGANLPEDAVYPTAFVDGKGAPLSGANKYVLHFDKRKLPPANAFWSITMYDQDGFQVPDSINRFAIGDRDKLAFNAWMVRSTYTYRPNRPARTRNLNRLPAPKNAPFQPTLRIRLTAARGRGRHMAPPPFRRCIERECSYSRRITLAATSKPNE